MTKPNTSVPLREIRDAIIQFPETILASRLQREKHGLDGMSGAGSDKADGRYHLKVNGTPVIYTSEFKETTELEIRKQYGVLAPNLIPPHFMFTYEIPVYLIKTYILQQMNKGWDSTPPTEQSQNFVLPDLREKKYAVYCLPAVTSVGAWTFLIDAAFPNIKELIKVVNVERHTFHNELPIVPVSKWPIKMA